MASNRRSLAGDIRALGAMYAVFSILPNGSWAAQEVDAVLSRLMTLHAFYQERLLRAVKENCGLPPIEVSQLVHLLEEP